MTESPCCEAEPKKGGCPQCGRNGKTVEKMTLENLLKEPSKIDSSAYLFCKNPKCDVVYFSNKGSFLKSDLKVRVGIKEKRDPIPLCYCFGWDRKRIQQEIRQTGKSTAVESITKEVKAGACFCERSNPQGSCCLGNVSAVVKEVAEGHEQGAKGAASNGCPTRTRT
jgi:hypothetical protein